MGDSENSETKKKIKRNICKCKQCGTILESTYTHHFAICKCPNETFTDGGREYIRRGGKALDLIEDLTEYK